MGSPWEAAVVGVLALTMAAGGSADAAARTLDLRGAVVRGKEVLSPAGEATWTIEANEARGATVTLAPDGVLQFAGHVHSEITATLAQPAPVPPAGYVFETCFSLSQPPGFYAHLLFLSPRVAGTGTAPAYRISYRFVSPCAVANNCTGFYLVNTASEAYAKDPLNAVPLAGARYRLAYDRKYTARAAVSDLPDGVRIRFYLDDPQVPGDDDAPLFEYTDRSPERLVGDGLARVQVGSGGLIHPAAPVRFSAVRLYDARDLAAVRGQASAPASPGLASPARPPVPPARTEVPNVFSDNLVIQRGKPVRIWGRGIERDEITVTLAGQTATGTVKDGAWRVELPPLPAGGPYGLSVKGRDRTLEIGNVAVGEVWVLGGQSNMGWWLENTTEAATEIPATSLPLLRVFSGWHPPADVAQFDLAGGTWKTVSPELKGRLSAVGYYLGKELHQHLGVPVGLIDTSTPATGIETWLSPAAAEAVYGAALHERPGRFPAGMQDPSVFYHGKVAPVMPVGIAGIAWYQGDGSQPTGGFAYRRYIAALIQDWRDGFGQGDVPFLVVQIPRFKGCSPEMRESQLLAVQGARRAGLAVTLETGDAEDIHPRNKRPVGERLALLARALAYGEAIECMGPVYRAMAVRQGKACLSFDHVGTGLVLKGEGGFEVCGADRAFRPATAAVSADGRELSVWNAAVPEPIVVRYAWAPVPEVSLYNREGLPASPFRTHIEPPRGL